MARTIAARMRGWGAVALLAMTAPAWGHKLAPHSTEQERRLAGMGASIRLMVERPLATWSMLAFTEPVHEEITNRIYGCNGDAEMCAGRHAITAPAPVLAGVRWNDDPPFRVNANQARGIGCKTRETIRFETQPLCWATLFEDANDGAAAGKRYGPGDAMLYRSHFGDLQFLHAMASHDGELAKDTRANVLGWMEFAWRTALGEYTLDTRLKQVSIPVIEAAFGRSEWRVLDLYTQGASGGLRQSYEDVAFGSLLHTLQDSYAEGHVEREESSGTQQCSVGDARVPAPGAILEFHAYNRQNHADHAEADTRAAFMRSYAGQGNVVDIGRALVQARREKRSWNEVQPFFDCVFALEAPNAPAGPGEFGRGQGAD